jgi:hypothetical protein
MYCPIDTNLSIAALSFPLSLSLCLSLSLSLSLSLTLPLSLSLSLSLSPSFVLQAFYLFTNNHLALQLEDGSDVTVEQLWLKFLQKNEKFPLKYKVYSFFRDQG